MIGCVMVREDKGQSGKKKEEVGGSTGDFIYTISELSLCFVTPTHSQHSHPHIQYNEYHSQHRVGVVGLDEKETDRAREQKAVVCGRSVLRDRKTEEKGMRVFSGLRKKKKRGAHQVN